MYAAVSYTARLYAELEHDVSEMNWKNLNQPVYTRQMTDEEKLQIFGGNPDYIKNIDMRTGDKKWSRV